MLKKEPDNNPERRGGRAELSSRLSPVDSEVSLRQVLKRESIDSSTLHLLFLGPHDLIFGLLLEGKQALRTWHQLHQLRAETGFSPVIIGAPREALYLVENVLERWQSTSPAELLETRARINPREWLDSRFDNPHRFVRGMWEEMEEGIWSEEIPKQSVDMLQELKWISSGGFHLPTLRKTAVIALLPTRHSLHAPAYLKFGGFNYCPHPTEHVALLENWNQRYGLALIGLNSESMALQVKNPPVDKAEVYQLAKDLFTYTDGDGLSEHSRRGFASSLLKSRVWS